MSLLNTLFPRKQSLAGQTRVVTGIKINSGGSGRFSETPGQLWGSSNYTAAGVKVDEWEALTISAVFAACFRLANISAMLPIGVYRKTDSGRKEQPDHPAARLLGIQANDAQTAFNARHFMAFWKPLFGSAVAEIGWDGAGRSRRLWPLAPWRVEPKYDDRDQLYYEVDGKRKIAARDIIYVPHVTSDGVTGKGFVDFALESLGQAIAADRSAGRFFENDMQIGGILQHDGNPEFKARQEFRNEWTKNHGGAENRGKTGVLWGGWKWVATQGGISPDDAQLLETRQWSVTEVARWLNVPPHWIAELSRATFSNIESQSIEALIYTVSPMLIQQEQEYDIKLLAPPSLYCKHNVNALLRTDVKSRGEFYKMMREIGAFSVNNVLALEDENGIGKEGEQRFVPVNWQPADDLMTGGEQQRKMNEAKAAAPNPTGSNDPAPAAASKPSKAVKKLAVEHPELSAALRSVAEHSIGQLSRKECNEARTAAKKPGDRTAGHRVSGGRAPGRGGRPARGRGGTTGPDVGGELVYHVP